MDRVPLSRVGGSIHVGAGRSNPRRFSEELNRAIGAAVALADGNVVHSGHLLSGVITAPTSMGARVLQALGISEEKLGGALEMVQEPGEAGDFSTPARRAMLDVDTVCAMGRLGQGDNQVYPVHLARSIVAEPTCKIATALKIRSDDFQRVWEWLEQSRLSSLGGRLRTLGVFDLTRPPTEEVALKLSLEAMLTTADRICRDSSIEAATNRIPDEFLGKVVRRSLAQLLAELGQFRRFERELPVKLSPLTLSGRLAATLSGRVPA